MGPLAEVCIWCNFEWFRGVFFNSLFILKKILYILNKFLQLLKESAFSISLLDKQVVCSLVFFGAIEHREDKRSVAFSSFFCFPQAEIKFLQEWSSDLQHLQRESVYLIFWHYTCFWREGGNGNKISVYKREEKRVKSPLVLVPLTRPTDLKLNSKFNLDK